MEREPVMPKPRGNRMAEVDGCHVVAYSLPLSALSPLRVYGDVTTTSTTTPR